MRLPEFVTFTGVDAATDLDEMERLSDLYPVEWGILFSATRQGNDPRYPDEATIRRALKRDLQFAAHLCGSYARSIMEGGRPHPFDLTPGGFGRIQVNDAHPDPARIESYCDGVWSARGIAQSRGDVFPETDEIDWLFDCSGGRGLAPTSYPPHPGGDRLVGYAGGIGPDNARMVIETIASEGPYWIDMEGRIRTGDDRLDLDSCRRVLEVVYPAVR